MIDVELHNTNIVTHGMNRTGSLIPKNDRWHLILAKCDNLAKKHFKGIKPTNFHSCKSVTKLKSKIKPYLTKLYEKKNKI